MVDFAKEQVIGVQRLAKRLGVSTDTIRRWFGLGLERQKICGKVFTSLEALNRFAGNTPQSHTPARLEESLTSLQRMGVNIGKEPNRDGHAKRTAP